MYILVQNWVEVHFLPCVASTICRLQPVHRYKIFVDFGECDGSVNTPLWHCNRLILRDRVRFLAKTNDCLEALEVGSLILRNVDGDKVAVGECYTDICLVLLYFCVSCYFLFLPSERQQTGNRWLGKHEESRNNGKKPGNDIRFGRPIRINTVNSSLTQLSTVIENVLPTLTRCGARCTRYPQRTRGRMYYKSTKKETDINISF